MKLKNIVIFFPNFSKGGIEKISLLLSNYFVSKGVKIKFICFDKINYKKFNFSENIRFYYSKKKNNNFLIRNIFCVFFLYNILKKHNKKDTVVFSLQNNILSIIISKYLGFKIIIRNSAPIDYQKNENSILNNFKLFLKLKIYLLSDLIISNSKSGARKIKDKLKKKHKILSIPNPLLKIEKIKHKIKKKNTILYVGRLSREKGIFELVEGFEMFQKKYPEFNLEIVGDGNQKKKLISMIKKKKLTSKINLINWSNKLDQYYKHSKILILPSFFEGFGNVLLEALNYRLPCVATRNDGPKEILNFGKYGLLMKNNKPETIYKSLSKMIENYNLYKLKSNAGNKNNQKYHINIIGSQYFSLLKNILKNK